MSWTTVIWSMIAGVCLALAGLYTSVWFRKRDAWEYFFFSMSAAGGAAMALLELALMQALTSAESGEFLRWLQVALAMTVVGLVWFVRFYLKAGNLRLAWLVCGMRALILVINFLPDRTNAVFLEMHDPLRVPMWGTLVSVSQGVRSSWELLGGVSSLAFLVYLYGASVQAWRRGERKRTVILSGGICLAFILGSIQARVLAFGFLFLPFSLSIPFMFIVLAMSFEMSSELVRAGQVASELRKSQEHMRLAAQAANLGMWEWDVVRNEIWTNEVSRTRLGAGVSEQLSFDDFLLIVHPDDREKIQEEIHRILKAGDEFTIEYRSIAPKGGIRWFSIIGRVERDADQKPLFLRGVSMDISERRRTEQALYRSEHFARTLLNTTDAMTHILDEEGTIIDLNDSMAKGLGGTREELIGTNVFDRFTRKSAERRIEAFRRVAREQKLLRFEDVDTEKDKMFDTIIFPLKEMQGEKQQFAVFAHDITDIRKMELAYNEGMERYKAIVESFDGFIYICSQDNRVEFMNQRMIERTGHDAVGEPCYRALHNNDDICEWCVNDKVFQGETVHWEVQSPKDNRWYYVVNTPIYHADGTISKQAMIQDITDRKHVETERVQLRLELAHLNRVMTLSELSSSLAHEINQPLGAILNNASAAKILHLQCKGGGQGEVGEILDDIIRDVNRAGQIVRKIRGMVKKGNVVFEPLEMNVLIEEVAELFRNPLSRERITLREDLSRDLLPVRGDRVHLQQVLMNLLMNATDAVKGRSSRVLTIRTAMQSPDMITVSFSDTGPGIEAGQLGKVFESFYTTKKDGLGIGLRICRSIVEEHGGRISVVNNPEGGATFSFSLPVSKGGSS